MADETPERGFGSVSLMRLAVDEIEFRHCGHKAWDLCTHP